MKLIQPPLWLISLFLLLATAPALYAAEKQEHGYAYQLENRSDPFSSFIKNTVGNSDDELLEPTTQLIGLQIFEPDQLKIVAIIKQSDGENVAMVQNLIGQGYPIRVGTLIGKRGVVKSIHTNNVVVEESATTRRGIIKKRTITMPLRPEGEE